MLMNEQNLLNSYLTLTRKKSHLYAILLKCHCVILSQKKIRVVENINAGKRTVEVQKIMELNKSTQKTGTWREDGGGQKKWVDY